MKIILYLLTALLLLSSCRSSRTIGKALGRRDTTARVAVPTDTPRTDTQQLIRATLQAVQANHINFTTFSAKVGIDYKGADGKGHDVNATLRMYKDSAIWLSVNAVLGFEAIRLLITKDSVKLLDKLADTYSARGIGFLQEAAGLPLDLYTLQELIIGNPVFLDSNIVRYEAAGGRIALVSLGALFKNGLTLREGDKALLHSKLTDTDPFRNRNADLWYEEYETDKGPLFSQKRQITVSDRGRLEIKLEFKNYTLNQPVSFPFSVPKNFKRS